MNPDIRAQVLAALREIYDGRWYRDVGTDGGRTLEWTGRIAVVGAVTTAWDTRARRRSPRWATGSCCCASTPPTHRVAAGRRAIGNTGDEARCAPSWPTPSPG